MVFKKMQKFLRGRVVMDGAPGTVKGDGVFEARRAKALRRINFQMSGTAQAKRGPVEFYRGKATGAKLGAGSVRNVLAT